MCTLLAADDVTRGPRAVCEDSFGIANQMECKAGRKVYLRLRFVIKVKWQLKFNAWGIQQRKTCCRRGLLQP